MRILGGALRLSASDVMRFQGCAHATTLDLRRLEIGDIEPAADDDEAALLARQGDAHELAYLDRLRAAGRSVVEIPKDGLSLERGVELTELALASGADVIYQGAFLSGPWGGYSDFLERVVREGRVAYEVVDTKLRRNADPKHVLQLSLYSDLLEEMQGIAPDQAHLELGDGSRVSVQLRDVQVYARRVRDSLQSFIAGRPGTVSEPCAACGLCRWRGHCASEWDAQRSVTLVAGITRSQRRRLAAVGVETIGELAARVERVPRLADATLASLRRQAGLQQARRAGGAPAFKLLDHVPGKGFDLLPRPDDGDVFYDIEGDPFHEGGLEYLHGFWLRDAGAWRFEAIWAHDRAAEGRAAADVVALLAARFRDHPDAHVYHYGHYEVAALRRLTSAHAVGEAAMDQLQRERRFVDLHRVVAGGLVASEPGYSIKDLEAFYMERRQDDVKTAGASVVYYERWREQGGDELLGMIRDYNETDCVSTKLLRDWLVGSVRPAALPWAVRESTPAGLADAEASDASDAAARAASDGLASLIGEQAAGLAADLAGYHRREDRPVWWSIFDRLADGGGPLDEDVECLGGLVAIGPEVPVTARSVERTYLYPRQDTKLRPGQRPCVRPADGPEDVDLRTVDPETHTVTLRRSSARGGLPDRLDLLPPKPIGNQALRDGILRTVERLAAGDPALTHVAALLGRATPRFAPGFDLQATVLEGGDLTSTIATAVGAMDRTVLPIQGPPGCGKTHSSAAAIVHLVRSGGRVAVSSGSHAAIANLLRTVADRAAEEGVPCSIVRKGPPVVGADEGVSVVSATDAPEIASADVFGATAWHFAAVQDQPFGHIFIDEAGQVSLANAVAIAGAARNLVLVGDPMQLAQPTRGSHPGGSGASCLSHLLGDVRVVAPDRGIFMPVSRRMHPSVCGFVSRAVYEGQLSSDAGAARQRLTLVDGTAVSGAWFRPVDHVGRSQVCPEEVFRVAERIAELAGATFVDRHGTSRPLAPSDILVVAPYNAQVNALAAALPAGVRVGTVDRFQGQEAPVCLISMATSGAEELPRDLEFLLGVNRLNVAVSRAQVLAEVFGSPRLLELPCRTISEMVMVNRLCLLADDGVGMDRGMERR